MNLSIRKWRIEDKSDLAINLNNLKVLNNLRDHMKILVDSGLVNDRKEGKWHYYSINTDIMKEFCGFIKTLCNETTGKCCKGKT